MFLGVLINQNKYKSAILIIINLEQVMISVIGLLELVFIFYLDPSQADYYLLGA